MPVAGGIFINTLALISIASDYFDGLQQLSARPEAGGESPAPFAIGKPHVAH